MDDADGQLGGRAEPHVRCERRRVADHPGREIEGERELRVELIPVEHDRPRDEIARRRFNTRGQRGHDAQRKSHVATLTCALVLAACQHDMATTGSAFYDWDERKVHCAINLDDYAQNDIASVTSGLERARDRVEVLEIYAHDPGRTVAWDKLEAVLAAIQTAGLPYFTYADFAHGVTPAAGVALSFDDAYIDHWLNGSDLYAQYGARLTFFVAYFDELTFEQRASLHELARLGHTIEAHSVNHLRAPAYVEERGLAAYVSDEVVPSIQELRDEGFEVTTFAYPYGARTHEIDREVLDLVPLVRSVSFTWTSPATDPCPK
jgi:hypothetical protein